MTSAPDHLRLNRYLARSGLGSRRGVEALIATGRVRLNGEIVTDLGRRVDPLSDLVTVDHKTITLPSSWSVYAFHKPAGVVSSLRAQGQARCLAEFRQREDLPAAVVPVGRLDAPTTGLLIWTDDGNLAEALLLPRHRIWKRYLMTLDRPLSPEAESLLTDGRIELDDRPCLPARLESAGPDRRTWRFWLREGRNRQIRRMILAVDRRVVSLHREAVGPLELGDLPSGRFRELAAGEVEALRSTLAASLEDHQLDDDLEV